MRNKKFTIAQLGPCLQFTNRKKSESGQTLMELVVVLAVSIIIIGALVFATISSLRNAQFAKNQSQATKLAQEALERVRSERDRGSNILGSFVISGASITSWDDPDLWSNQINGNCAPNCYFIFNGTLFQYLIAANKIPSNAEDPLGDGKFKRVIILSDEITPADIWKVQKTVTVVVQWTDFSGLHESRLTTILRKI